MKPTTITQIWISRIVKSDDKREDICVDIWRTDSAGNERLCGQYYHNFYMRHHISKASVKRARRAIKSLRAQQEAK